MSENENNSNTTMVEEKETKNNKTSDFYKTDSDLPDRFQFPDKIKGYQLVYNFYSKEYFSINEVIIGYTIPSYTFVKQVHKKLLLIFFLKFIIQIRYI